MSFPICKQCLTYLTIASDGICDNCRIDNSSIKQTTNVIDLLTIEVAKLSRQIQELKSSVKRLTQSIDWSKSIGRANGNAVAKQRQEENKILTN